MLATFLWKKKKKGMEEGKNSLVEDHETRQLSGPLSCGTLAQIVSTSTLLCDLFMKQGADYPTPLLNSLQ